MSQSQQPSSSLPSLQSQSSYEDESKQAKAKPTFPFFVFASVKNVG
jgi:hypothetical protein